MIIRISTCLAAAILTISAAQAQVTVTDPWVRATVANQQATGAFMKITSATDAKLIEARSPLAGVTELHEMAFEGDVMRMRAVTEMALPANQTVELRPGGLHLMFFDLKSQAKEGDTVPISLVVETADGKRETVEVSAPVKPMNMMRRMR